MMVKIGIKNKGCKLLFLAKEVIIGVNIYDPLPKNIIIPLAVPLILEGNISANQM